MTQSGRMTSMLARRDSTKSRRRGMIIGSSPLLQRKEVLMIELEKGITSNGSRYAGKAWSNFGPDFYPKAICDAAFAFRGERNESLQQCQGEACGASLELWCCGLHQ